MTGELLDLAQEVARFRALAEREKRARVDAERFAEDTLRKLYLAMREIDQLNVEVATAHRAKHEFLSVVSHELRTPLTSVIGFASLLADSWDTTDEQQKRDFVDIIETQARRLANLIEDMLTVAQLRAGTSEAKPMPLELSHEVQMALDGLADRAQEVDVECPPGLVVLADPVIVRRILLNYLDNAFRYGAGPIRLHAQQTDGEVEVAVTDEGPGVPPEVEQRLFDSFTQAEMDTTRTASGTGLGLAIVKGLAHLQGSEVHYEPNQPTGARFVLRLSAADTES